MPDVFLSYSRDDQVTARRFAEGLGRAGFTVWWDQSLNPGEAFDQVTEKALEEARAVVVLWSKSSVASRWVRAEATQANADGRLIPVMIEACKRPIMFELTHTVDLSAWSGDPADPSWQSFIAGLHRLTGKVAAVAGAASATEVSSALSREPAAARPVPRRWSPAFLAAGAVALLALVASGAWWLGRGSEDPPPAAVSTAPVAGAELVTLAVLPFTDMSPNKDQEHLADGLAEEILNSLARIGGNLQITGRTSSFYFKGRNEEWKSIGEKLGVAYLLEGSVRKQGEQLRITTQLVKAADGFHLWSQTYDRPMQDVFRVQEDIARSVAEALQVALGVGDLGRIPGMTNDVQAYEAFLEALRHSNKLNLEDYQLAAERLKDALRRDPGFEIGWFVSYAALMNAWSLAGSNAPLAESLLARANAVRDEVSRRFPDSPRAQAFLRSTGATARGDWIAESQRAIEEEGRPWDPALGPEPPFHSTAAALARIRLDKASAAITDLERARRQDPLRPEVLIYLPEAYANLGRFEEAMREQDRAWDVAPSLLIAANSVLTAIGAGDAARARVRWEWLLSLQPQTSAVRTLHSLQGQPEEVRAHLRRMAAQPNRMPASQLALYAAAFGDPELALQVMREDRDLQRRQVTVLALWRPVFRKVRALPGFKDLVRDWGLVDYWKQHGWGEHCKPVGEDDFECR